MTQNQPLNDCTNSAAAHAGDLNVWMHRHGKGVNNQTNGCTAATVHFKLVPHLLPPIYLTQWLAAALVKSFYCVV